MSLLVEIKNDTISVHRKEREGKFNTLWVLKHADIKTIGVALRMLDDDWEHDYIVFVTRDNQEYIVDYWQPEIKEVLKGYLLRFNLDIDKEIEAAHCKDLAVYPESIKGEKLYEFSFLYALKRLITFYLPYKSLGKLSAKVRRFNV